MHPRSIHTSSVVAILTCAVIAGCGHPTLQPHSNERETPRQVEARACGEGEFALPERFTTFPIVLVTPNDLFVATSATCATRVPSPHLPHGEPSPREDRYLLPALLEFSLQARDRAQLERLSSGAEPSDGWACTVLVDHGVSSLRLLRVLYTLGQANAITNGVAFVEGNAPPVRLSLPRLPLAMPVPDATALLFLCLDEGTFLLRFNEHSCVVRGSATRTSSVLYEDVTACVDSMGIARGENSLDLVVHDDIPAEATIAVAARLGGQGHALFLRPVEGTLVCPGVPNS